jgi:O-antigen/teichoic acid export membrane protein
LFGRTTNRDREHTLRRSLAVQGLAFCLLVAGLAYLVVSSADSWADWVVFGVLVLTALGAAIAAYDRRWPTRGRPISRSSDQRR